MAWSKVTRTAITGLAASGTADELGTWNEDVDLDSFVTVPSGATGAIIHVYNSSSSNRWLGVRTPGKTTPLLLYDAPRERSYVIVPLGAGNTIDLYTENTSQVTFHIVGFTNTETIFFDIDGPLPTLPSTGSSYANRDLSAIIPEGAVAAIFLGFAGRWRPTGGSDGITSSPGARGTAIVQLDSGRTADFNTGAAQKILGYMTGGVEFEAWPVTAASITDDGTWRDYPDSNAAADFAFILADKSAAGIYALMRGEGESDDPTTIVQATETCMLTPTGTGGALEYKAESGGTHGFKTIAWFPAASDSSDTTVSPAQAAITAEGLAPSINPFTSIALRGTLVNEAGSPVGNATGLHVLVWYGSNPSGAPDESLSAQTTNENGSYSFALALGGLSYNDPVYRVIYSGDPPTANHCGRRIPSYDV